MGHVQKLIQTLFKHIRSSQIFINICRVLAVRPVGFLRNLALLPSRDGQGRSPARPALPWSRLASGVLYAGVKVQAYRMGKWLVIFQGLQQLRKTHRNHTTWPQWTRSGVFGLLAPLLQLSGQLRKTKCDSLACRLMWSWSFMWPCSSWLAFKILPMNTFHIMFPNFCAITYWKTSMFQPLLDETSSPTFWTGPSWSHPRDLAVRGLEGRMCGS